MNKQRKKLTLNKETLRDLMAQNAGEVKGGVKPLRVRQWDSGYGGWRQAAAEATV